jgi:hypothetical protein
MTADDLDAVAKRHGPRLAWLVSGANPDAESREGYRRVVRDLAAGPTEQPSAAAAYPPVLTQLGNAAAAVGRFVGSGCETVDRAEFDRRRSICAVCPHLDAEADRCRLCSCYLAVKPWSRAERCPEGRWEAPHDAH